MEPEPEVINAVEIFMYGFFTYLSLAIVVVILRFARAASLPSYHSD